MTDYNKHYKNLYSLIYNSNQLNILFKNSGFRF